MTVQASTEAAPGPSREALASLPAVLRAGDWRGGGTFDVTLADGDGSPLRTDSTAIITAPDGGTIVGRIGAVARGDVTEVRVGLFDRRLLKAVVGEPVTLEVVAHQELAMVDVRVGFEQQVMASQRFENRLRTALVGNSEVMASGRVMRADGAGLGRCLVEVAGCEPQIGVVGPDTELRVSYVSQLELASVGSYADVGGLEGPIDELRRYAHAPLLAPERYRHVGVTPPRGILLYGPPGTGKTHLARAAAGELAVHCITVSGPELVGTKYGETEASLRKLFHEAMESTPAVIVVDEIDALAPRRGASGAQADARIVTQILSLLDGLVALDGIVILATTNRIEAVEPALRRPGRLDREIFVGPPDETARQKILAVHTRAMPLSAGARKGLADIAARTPGFVGADLMALCREAGLASVERMDDPGRNGKQNTASEVGLDDFERALEIVQPAGIRSAVARFDAPTWDGTWGMGEAKDELLTLAKEVLSPTSPLAGEGMLLSGPSGSGKTVMAEGLAGELGANLVRLRGSDVFSKWLGESEQAVRETFELARHLRPTVLFIDHLDSLAPKRGSERPEMASQRVRDELLVELDGSHNEGIVVVAATNAPNLVDESVTRPGRLGIHLALSAPAAGDRRSILDGCLGSLGEPPLTRGERSEVVRRTDGWTPAELAMLVRRASATATGPRGAASLEQAMLRLVDIASAKDANDIGERYKEAT